MQVQRRRPQSIIASSMHVPEHISVTGETVYVPGSDDRRGRERMIEMMTVPDKIILTGGEGYRGYAAEPRLPEYSQADGKNDIRELPSHITVDSLYPDEPTVVEDVRSTSSIAIDENPLQELKLMRRQLTRVSNRLYQLEDEIERRKVRENKYFISTFVGFAAALVLFFIRR